MTPESRSENMPVSRWSILHGRFIPELASYRGWVKSIEERVSKQWRDDIAAPRILVADIVQSAVEISQPELFTDTDLRKTVAKDIGTSVFACYSYSERDLQTVEDKAREEIDLEEERIPAVDTLKALLEDSKIALPSGQDLERVCQASLLHVLLKQRGRSAELPPARYN